MEHTPGPWTLEETMPGLIPFKTIVRMGPGPTDFVQALTEADARLIAAAPDLLAALENLTGTPTRDWDGTLEDYGKKRLREAREAIAKAKG